MTISRHACCCVTALCLALAAPAIAQVSPTQPATGAGAKAQPSSRMFTDLFRSAVTDFRHLPSADTAKWLGLGAAVALIGHRVDDPATKALSGPSFDAPFEAGDALGGFKMQLGGAFATYAVGHLAGRPRAAALGTDLLRAQLITKTLTVGLKAAVRRTRPDGTPWSFPSGHSSATFASATVLQRHFGWRVGVPAFGVASYVAASRIQERRHFLSDVAFGAAIGIIAGRTVTVGRAGHRFAMSPVAVPGGAGISFSLLKN